MNGKMGGISWQASKGLMALAGRATGNQTSDIRIENVNPLVGWRIRRCLLSVDSSMYNHHSVRVAGTFDGSQTSQEVASSAHSGAYASSGEQIPKN